MADPEKDYVKEEAYQQWDNALKDYNKYITYISSGAFAISFAFIDKIVKVEKATNNCILLYALIFFAIPIFIGLLSYFGDIFTNAKFINLLDDVEDADESKLKTAKENAEAYRRTVNVIDTIIRVIQILFLIAGSSCLLYYIGSNFKL